MSLRKKDDKQLLGSVSYLFHVSNKKCVSARKHCCVAPVQHPKCLKNAYLRGAKDSKALTKR